MAKDKGILMPLAGALIAGYIAYKVPELCALLAAGGTYYILSD